MWGNENCNDLLPLCPTNVQAAHWLPVVFGASLN
jgi:hypothetical protein